ncbi:hypothetical protein BN12_4110001 [Nostocoides japonicum T1-X7]|uniref:Uncharacterized protein n=1 Tax=Nostocoides japonicum T1-X7 TaxID=1194083 RepID=A0A077LZE2_9MICO|nr:hypothetical protein BN12_4110001 [Tetrasphaera japonica T1-X7]
MHRQRPHDLLGKTARVLALATFPTAPARPHRTEDDSGGRTLPAGFSPSGRPRLPRPADPAYISRNSADTGASAPPVDNFRGAELNIAKVTHEYLPVTNERGPDETSRTSSGGGDARRSPRRMQRLRSRSLHQHHDAPDLNPHHQDDNKSHYPRNSVQDSAICTETQRCRL